ncbi:MAG: Asp-tRNA(Asn)/Glu-tRNA(Gln) amidotransferase subunit GatC [Clostridiales bacterium]|nr:Asp-tRNA(Asn)/Glu-tRNA(Gln) amidotransferase subunit GatC [Clostridiales bacterium]
MNIDIRHIAELSRLRINDDELEKFEEDMENIVKMIEKLPNIDEELTLNTDDPLILREDIAVENRYTRQELMQNAPSVKAGCLVVPKTIE